MSDAKLISIAIDWPNGIDASKFYHTPNPILLAAVPTLELMDDYVLKTTLSKIAGE